VSGEEASSVRLAYGDAHCHSNPVSGLGARMIARRFRKAGGWFIGLVALPPYYYGFSEPVLDSYRKTLDLVVKEAEEARSEGVKVRILAGFHPAEVDEHFRRGMDLKGIVELAYNVLDLIVEYHSRGLIDGIGEVGRQHYSTAPARIIASEIILRRAMQLARDNDMIMHLHLEQGGWVTVESIRMLADWTGIPRERVFLHHVSPNEAEWGERSGFWYTVPAKQKTMRKIFSSKPSRGMVESDYIDDPKRPGVSAYPWDIPVRLGELLKEGVIDEEYAWKIMVDNISLAYRVEPP
jgi:TatD-related deoxyribonuclease